MILIYWRNFLETTF